MSVKLPENIKKEIGKLPEHIKLLIYGESFVGKTLFADSFPEVLFLSTDGNTKMCKSPAMMITDEIIGEGKLATTKYGWHTFKEVVDLLGSGNNTYKTIVVDLIDDVYESCRICKCKELGISHEADDSFKAYDKVRTEFLYTLRKLVNMNYNIILISLEDASRDIMARSGTGITSITPNITDKVAKKITSMMDVVARAVKEDERQRYLLVNPDDGVIAGGSRFPMKKAKIPLAYEDFIALYEFDDSLISKENLKGVKPESKLKKTKANKPEVAEEVVSEAPKAEEKDPLTIEIQKPVYVEATTAETVEPIKEAEEIKAPETVKKTRSKRL